MTRFSAPTGSSATSTPPSLLLCPAYPLAALLDDELGHDRYRQEGLSGFQNSAVRVDVRFQAARSYSLISPPHYRLAPDPPAVKIRSGMIGALRERSQRSILRGPRHLPVDHRPHHAG